MKTTQQRFEEWLGCEYDLPDCVVVPIQLLPIGYNDTVSHLLDSLNGAFDLIPTEAAEKLRTILESDESVLELRLCNMVYSSDAKFDDDAPPYCQALVSVELGMLRKAIRAARENYFDWVVIEPYDVQLFTNDWEEVDAGRYGNFNELFVRSRNNPRVELSMTHKDNPDCYLKFDNV
jgi:hypothetical protein